VFGWFLSAGPLGSAEVLSSAWVCYLAFGPVSGSAAGASLRAGSDVEPLASLRGCPPAGTSVPSWLHRMCQ
jgi:hypothetical protein